MARRPLNLTRDQLASFLKDPEQIKQFENLFASARNPQLAGGAAGSIPYQSGDTETTFLPIGTPWQILQVNPTADAPEWVSSTGSGNVVRSSGPTLSNPNINNPTITNGRATNLDYVGFNNTPTLGTVTPGTVYWDDGNGTLSLNLKGGNVDCLIGEQEYARVYNDTASTLTKGQVVYISGAQGNRVAVKLAQADSDANSAHTIGFVAETIAAGGEGWVQISGPMYKLNTLGTTAGDTVYLSPTTPGLWMTAKPVAPNHLVVLGFIERVHATVGSIFIKVDNGYELDELHNVKITSVANNDILQYDSSGPFWKNVAPSAVSVGIATNLAGGTAGAIPYQTAQNTTSFANGLFWDNTNKFLGIGTSGPSAKLTVGSVSFAGGMTGQLAFVSDTNASGNAETTVIIGQGATSVGSWVGLVAGVTGGGNPYFSIKTRPIAGGSSVERLRIDGAGNVLVTGIGGIGYGTGSGGAVTQATSRTTGVTLNKTNGAITLVSAAGTTAWQSFTVTNNTVAATDTVIVSQKSGTDFYMIHVTNVSAGSFQITFATTGGTTTEQPVFNFAVIKAVTS